MCWSLTLRKLSLATPLSAIGSIVHPGTAIEMTPFKQLYVFVDESKLTEAEEELAKAGLKSDMQVAPLEQTNHFIDRSNQFIGSHQ
jgi:hypothetical protein